MCIGTWLDSNTVPMRTVKGFRQARQFHNPARVVLPFERDASPSVPQCGQTGPFGQRCASTKAKAAASSVKWATLSSDFMTDRPVDLTALRPGSSEPASDTD